MALMHLASFIAIIFTGSMSVFEIIMLSKTKETRKLSYIYICFLFAGIALITLSGLPYRWIG